LTLCLASGVLHCRVARVEQTESPAMMEERVKQSESQSSSNLISYTLFASAQGNEVWQGCQKGNLFSCN